MSNTNIYESPLSSRYASDEMLYLFSPDKKFTTWRRLWVALARAEMELGLPVTKEQVEELEAHIDDINYEVAAKEEKKLRHDVMAHVHAYGAQCPKADAHHPSGRHKLLCGGQHRHYTDAGGLDPDSGSTGPRPPHPCPLCRNLSGAPDPGLYPFSTSAAGDGGEESHAMDE